MEIPGIPFNEDDRLRNLNEYAILDTIEEQEYDDITFLASVICGTPIALITIIDHNRQWFKSHHGLDVRETSRENSFCAHAINDPEHLLLVKDSREDSRFHDNPLVSDAPNIIFYAGMPLVNSEGFCFGTLCVIDNKPKEMNQTQIKALIALSKQVVKLLDLRRKNILLEHVKVEIEDRSAELERFAHVAAHDLKSPLNSISALTNLLLQHYNHLDKEVLEIFDHLNKSSLKLKTLINDILNNSLALGTIELPKEDVALRSFAEDIVRLIKVHDSEFILNGFDVMVHLNKTALQQILMNLISNGIKYNFEKKVIIELSHWESDSSYHFSVKDNGAGIKKENQEQIFELFNRTDIQDRFDQSGTGVGLHTVKRLITEQGGEIFVDSEPGKGSTFSFSIRK